MRRLAILLALVACERGALTVTDGSPDTDPVGSDDGVPTDTDPVGSDDDGIESDDPAPDDTGGGETDVDTDPGVDTDEGPGDTDEDPVDTEDPPPVPVCGDGAVDAGELCDDDNTADGDGCSATCLRERFRITIVSAQLADRQPDGATWDPGFVGTSIDGEVLGFVAGQGRIDTRTAWEDTTPEWNEGFDVDVPGGQTLNLVVRDQDWPVGAEDLHTFVLPLADLNGYAALRSVDLSGPSVARLTIQVAYR